MERQVTPKNTKKKIYKYYNCGIKGHLARNYRKLRAGAGPQKK